MRKYMYVPVFGEERYTIQTKWHWRDATEVDVIQPEVGVRVLAAIQTFRRDSKSTSGIPFCKKMLIRLLAMLLIKTGITRLC